jgi:hypothetical protein
VSRNLRFTEAQLAAHNRGEKIIPTEHEEQVRFFAWWRTWAPSRSYETCLCFAIPNASRLTDAGRVYKWAEGLTPGVSDIFIAIPSRGYNGMFIEMKRATGDTTYNQETFIQAVLRKGYVAGVAYSADEAIRLVLAYLPPANEPRTI